MFVSVYVYLEQWQLILVSCLISFIIRLTAEYRGSLSHTHYFLSYLSFFPMVLLGNTWSSAPFPSTSYHIQICLIWNVNKGQTIQPFHHVLQFQTHLISTVPFLYTPHTVPCEFNGDSRIQLFCGLSNCWHDSVSDMVRGCPGHMCTSLDGWDRLAVYGLSLTIPHRCTIGQSQSCPNSPLLSS